MTGPLISPVPPAVLSANQVVADRMGATHAAAVNAEATYDQGGAAGPELRPRVEQALGAARAALDGLEGLGANNAFAADVHLQAARAAHRLAGVAELIDSGRAAEAPRQFGQELFEARVSAQLGVEAAARSLQQPTLRKVVRPEPHHVAGEARPSNPIVGAGPGPAGITLIDGGLIDALGNPSRSSGGWAGPDGELYRSDGSAWSGLDSDSGPGGTYYPGV